MTAKEAFRSFVQEFSKHYPTLSIVIQSKKAVVILKSGLILKFIMNDEDNVSIHYGRKTGTEYTPTMIEEREAIRAVHN